MKHPLALIPAHRRSIVFIPALLLTFVTMLALNLTGESLRTDAAPSGIVSFELAGDVHTVQAVLESWDANAKVFAGFNLGLDYLFLVAYSTTIALAIVWTSVGWIIKQPAITIVTLLAWGQWLAAILDAIENGALMTMLVGGAASPWPEIAYWCAVAKFVLVIVGLVYVLVAGISRFVRSRI